MDRLPVEIMTMVVQSMIAGENYHAPGPWRNWRPPPRLAPLASLSKRWAAVVEPFTFDILDLSRSRLPQLGRIVKGHRRSLISRIRYDIVLDAYSNEACGHYETGAEKARNDLVFTESVVYLLNRLAAWLAPQMASYNAAIIMLCINAWSPSDIDYCCAQRQRERYDYKTLRQEGIIDIQDARHERSALRLDITKLSPYLEVPGVIRLEFAKENTSRKVAAQSVADVAVRLPHLISLKARMSENEKFDHEARRYERRSFASHLELMPHRLEEIRLDFGTDAPLDHTFELPSLTLPDHNVSSDPLSRDLGLFCQSLTKVTLRNTVLNADDFFALAPETCWPRLRVMKLHFTNITASGQWYHDFPPDTDPEDFLDPFLIPQALPTQLSDMPPQMDLERVSGRIVPNRELFSTLYISAAKAVRRMPHLKHMRIKLEPTFNALDDSFEGAHHFQYTYAEKLRARSSARSNAIWHCIPAYIPTEEVLNAWKTVATEAQEETCISIIKGDEKDPGAGELVANY